MPQPLALIIEDQKNLAELYEDSLRLVGFNVRLIYDGLEALNHLQTHSLPDFIILDVNLPSLSGREILKHIRSSDKYENVPVLVLTANTLMIDQIRPDISEMDYLHAKPIGMLELQNYAKKVRTKKKELSDSRAVTQPIPVINDDNDEPSEVIFPDNTIRDTSEVPVADKKVQTQEHKAILTPDDTAIEIDEPKSDISAENEDEAT